MSTVRRQGVLPLDLLLEDRARRKAASGMARWRTAVFGVVSRNARSATHSLGLPPNRVVELGAQIEVLAASPDHTGPGAPRRGRHAAC